MFEYIGEPTWDGYIKEGGWDVIIGQTRRTVPIYIQYVLYTENNREGRVIVTPGENILAWQPNRASPASFPAGDVCEALEWVSEGTNAPLPPLDMQELPVFGSPEFHKRKLSDGRSAREALPSMI